MIKNLEFDLSLIQNYKNKSQISRILTENWVLNNSYCPNCSKNYLKDFQNNLPVADFYCESCNEEFELKSKEGNISTKIIGGSYETMIERINSDNNPNFFLLTYKNNSIENFLIIPKHFFISEIIIQRKPLSETAKRAGRIGCNIDISNIPESGKIFLVRDSIILSQNEVINNFQKTLFLREKTEKSKGWIIEIMKCIDLLRKEIFTLDDIYKFENSLKIKFPNNNFIKDKIRQQLQFLRNKGFLEFKGNGIYRKT